MDNKFNSDSTYRVVRKLRALGASSKTRNGTLVVPLVGRNGAFGRFGSRISKTWFSEVSLFFLGVGPPFGLQKLESVKTANFFTKKKHLVCRQKHACCFRTRFFEESACC